MSSKKKNSSKNPFPHLILGLSSPNQNPSPVPANLAVQNTSTAVVPATVSDGIEAPQYNVTEGNHIVRSGRWTRLVTAEYEYDSLDGNGPRQQFREYLQLFKMAACILPMCPAEGKYQLIRQFRYPAWYNAQKRNLPSANQDAWLYEVIAGVIEIGDTPINTAIREAQEEGDITLDPDNVSLIHKTFMTPGITNEEMYIYAGLVDQTAPIGQTGLDDEGEHIRAKWMTAEEIRRLAAQGLIRDAKTLIALYAARVL